MKTAGGLTRSYRGGSSFTDNFLKHLHAFSVRFAAFILVALMPDVVWSDFIFSFVTLLVLVLIEKIYQTLETAFHFISKHIEFHQKYSTKGPITW